MVCYLFVVNVDSISVCVWIEFGGWIDNMGVLLVVLFLVGSNIIIFIGLLMVFVFSVLVLMVNSLGVVVLVVLVCVVELVLFVCMML